MDTKLQGVRRRGVQHVHDDRTGERRERQGNFRARAGQDQQSVAEQVERGSVPIGQPNVRDPVGEGLRAAASVYAAERDVSRTIYSMWALEPDAVRGAFEVVERGRVEGQRRLAARLAQEGHLRGDLTVEQAVDILWVITSFETFDQLYTERGLSVDDTAARLVLMAERALWAD